MAIVDMIPVLDDKELANLRANALRLESSGNPKQQADAADLLPMIEAEVAARIARKPVKAKKAPAKRKVKVVAEESEEAEEAEAEAEVAEL